MLVPFFLTIRLMWSSLESMLNDLSWLSNTKSTEASLPGFFAFVPWKIKFELFAARMLLLDNLPKTKQSASDMFDFPEPFGPMITLMSLSNGISVLVAKDLNPETTSFFMKAMFC